MDTNTRAQTTVGSLATQFRAVIAWFGGTIRATQTHHSPVAERPNTAEQARAAGLFAQAVQESSNLELDWLWYATQMTDVAEQRYCLLQALEINPESEMARRALANLPHEAMETTPLAMAST